MEVSGKLHVVMDTQEVSASFKKREFVLLISENPQYPQYVTFQLVQEKCVLVDAYQPGAEVTVLFNLRGRQWTSPQGETKYFNTLEAWSIRNANTTPVQQTAGQVHNPVAPSVPKQEPHDIGSLNDSDDLPF